jgi:hypothetical protein
MKTIVILICSLAIVSSYGAQKQEKKSQPKKQAQASQHAAQPRGRPAAAGAGGKKTSNAAYQGQNARNNQSSMAAYNAQKGKKNQTSIQTHEGRKGNHGQASATAYQGQKEKKNRTSPREYDRQKVKQSQASTAAYQGQKGKKNQAQVERQTGKAAKGGQVTRGGNPSGAATATRANASAKGKAATGKPFKPRHFNVAKQPNVAKAPAVRFQQGRRIQGSQNWQGQQYTVFRNYKSQWHDQNWWRSRYRNNIVFVFGAPYYWNAGYWFPAWGYNPNAYYAWDGPIYAYNHLPPDQVIANVQAALQEQGYYRGEVDGLIGPLTRGAIADYQRDHGLYTTSTIDQPTLRSLGMA